MKITVESKNNYVKFKDLENGSIFKSKKNDRYFIKITEYGNQRDFGTAPEKKCYAADLNDGSVILFDDDVEIILIKNAELIIKED